MRALYFQETDFAGEEEIKAKEFIIDREWDRQKLADQNPMVFTISSHDRIMKIWDADEKLVVIASLCVQHCDFYVKKEIDVENHPRYKDKDSSAMFDVLFQESLPQQLSGSLDCGIYIVTYTDCLSYGHKVLANEFDPNALRTRYVALLWEYGTRKQDANAHSDVEAPLRPARQSRITSVTEVFDV
ncbi:hypothetical protein FXO37_05521 [Capsicum annuum]|nr:hypothetical protein FXO37_05521 [Capsicum annuum]